MAISEYVFIQVNIGVLLLMYMESLWRGGNLRLCRESLTPSEYNRLRINGSDNYIFRFYSCEMGISFDHESSFWFTDTVV